MGNNLGEPIQIKDGYVPREEISERTRRAKEDAGQLEYDAVRVQHFVENELPHVRRILATRDRPYSVLDVGCGYGRHAPYLCDGECRYLGLDPNADRVAYATAHQVDPRMRFVVADAATWRSEKRFDLIWCCTVLQHLAVTEKLAICRMMRDHLAPGGVILIYEGKVFDESIDWCRTHYESAECPEHMIPVPLAMLRDAFAPLRLDVIHWALFRVTHEGPPTNG